MTVQSISLSKLLKLFYSDSGPRLTALRNEIRSDLRRAEGDSAGGGDFYVPFWSDAKNHVLIDSDLRAATDARIKSNPRRRNLYPLLADGFLTWWNERRRWTNAPYIRARHISNQIFFSEFNATVKTQSLLSVTDGRNEDHHVYPYFSADPALGVEGARIGLWVLSQSFPEVPLDELRILDVLSGKSFSNDRSQLQGNESQRFSELYEALIAEYDALHLEY